MNSRLVVLSLGLASLTAGVCAAAEASREVGQPDFRSFLPNRIDARGMAQPWGVAVDTSRSPHGLWVLDAGNNRILGWRDVTALRDGAPADVIIGQPDAITSGCNTGGVSAASLCLRDSFAVYKTPGLAVDGEGNLFVSDPPNYRVLGYRRPFETDGTADLVIGQTGFDKNESPSARPMSASLLFEPSGLAVDAQGDLYISDSRRVVELDRPFATDTVADRAFGQSRPDAFDPIGPGIPNAPDQIWVPEGIAVDAMGHLFVADTGNDRVMVWKQPLIRQGAADLIFSPPNGDGEDPFKSVDGIAVEPNGDLWVGSGSRGKIFGYRSPLGDGDTEPDRILAAVYPRNVYLYDPRVPGDGRPMFATGALAVDSTGTLWLTDVNRTLGFSDPWNGDSRADLLLGQVRRDQLAPNLVDRYGLEQPDGLALDTSANPPHLYVVDTANHRVLGWADAEGFADGQPADLVLGQPDAFSAGCNTGGVSLSSLCLGDYVDFNYFNGLAVDVHGTVWISDQRNDRVLGFRSPFTTDTVADLVLGGSGCGSSQGLCSPDGLAVDKKGNLYVADIGNNRILEYNEPSRRDTYADRVLGARNFRSYGCGDPATCFSEPNFNHPPDLDIFGGSLAVDADGRLLVGNKSSVYVFERPLSPGARSRKLITFSSDSFSISSALATDSTGRIYVTADNVVYRFSRDGSGPTLVLGGSCIYNDGTSANRLEVGRASLCRPKGLAVGPRDELFVSDFDANRVVVFENP
jgi:sugar lactone lactonase YvrE